MKKKKLKKEAAPKNDNDGAAETSLTEAAPEAAPEPNEGAPAHVPATHVAADDEKAVSDEKSDEPSSSGAPSLAQQSKMRSTSFRAGSATSPPVPLSADGDTAADIYRKQAARIEELERDNSRLTKDVAEAEKRWNKAENELSDLREAEGETPGSKGRDDEVEKLVRRGAKSPLACPLPANW